MTILITNGYQNTSTNYLTILTMVELNLQWPATGYCWALMGPDTYVAVQCYDHGAL